MDVLRPAVLTGVGAAMTADEIVFHQLLGWHHLHTPTGRVSDGVLHLVATAALVVGVFLVARSEPSRWRRVAGGVLVGSGGFNLYDGVVQHKLMGLHQVREGVPNLLPYDVTWIAASLAVLLAGLVVVRGSRSSR